jgi:hypothetical protein
MSRRIDIELTSSLNDGTWTWRAAGARQPRGVLDGSILPSGSKVGDELKVEVEQELEGITVLSVVSGREKQTRELIDLLPVERDFQPVIETRAKRERGERPRRDDGDRRPRRDRDRDGNRSRNDRGDRPPRGDGGGTGGAGGAGGERPRRDGAGRGPGRSETAGGPDGRGRDRRRQAPERRGPSFTPPPEVPQRPKPKRLRPGKTNRTAVLADLPAEQRPIAELALQGLPAVRQRLREENERAVAEGRATMPEASVLKLAEELLPRLRVAEWRDRAEAAKAQASDLDLRDLRSVVVAAGDPIVARDESTRVVADELRQLLVTKQEQELQNWYADIDAALAVGRVIRALRLSSQPPKAGVPFPADIAQRLADSTNASLTPMDAPDRWAAMLEAAAFSPVRSLVRPVRKPDAVSDELTTTVARLAPALPQIAALFEIEVDPKATMPKPLRPSPRPTKGKPGDKPADAKQGDARGERGDRKPKSPKSGPAPQPPATLEPPITIQAVDELETTPTSAADPEAPADSVPEPDSTPSEASPPATEPVAESEPETIAEPEPVAESEPETIAEPEPVTEPEPVAESEPEPVTEPEPVAERDLREVEGASTEAPGGSDLADTPADPE